jgi:hypothetical protein
VGLRFRDELFNLFNHPNFGPPDSNLTDALFGQSTQTLAGSLGSGGANGGFNPSIKSAARARSNWRLNFNSEQTACYESPVLRPVNPRDTRPAQYGVPPGLGQVFCEPCLMTYGLES